VAGHLQCCKSLHKLEYFLYVGVYNVLVVQTNKNDDFGFCCCFFDASGVLGNLMHFKNNKTWVLCCRLVQWHRLCWLGLSYHITVGGMQILLKDIRTLEFLILKFLKKLWSGREFWTTFDIL